LRIKNSYKQVTISPQEESLLIVKIKSGDSEALARLIEAYRHVAYQESKRYIGQGIPFRDLVSDSYGALINAARRYDSERHKSFKSYASWWIRQELTSEIARIGRPVTIPLNAYMEGRKFLRQKDHLEQIHGRSIDFDAAVEELNIPPDKAENLESVLQQDLSLDAPLEGAEEPGMTMLDALVYEDQLSPVQVTEADMVRERIEKALTVLTPREKNVIRMTFGFEEKRRTIAETSGELGISPNKIKKLRKKALAKLKDMGILRQAVA